MAKVIIRDYALSWAPDRRRHQNGGAIKFHDNGGNVFTSGPTYTPETPGLTTRWPVGTGTGNFAYMTVSGGTAGTFFYTAKDLENNRPMESIPVGDADIVVSKIYVPTGGGPNTSNPVLYVDAFNVTTGLFIDNDFVTVNLNGTPNQILTTTVNIDGIVPTKNVSNEHVMAFTNIGADQAFVKWELLAGDTETNTGTDLTAGNNTTAYYLAFYQTPEKFNFKKDFGNYAQWRHVLPGEAQDGGPVPWNPELAQWASGILMANYAKYTHPKLQKQVLELASKQIAMAGEAISKTVLNAAKEVETN